MPSPLAAETVLQGRYRLLQLLAEGGFARTYLAEDKGRFGERCVVKEFCPLSNDSTVFEKAQELFQREAQTLYRLAHPQVPRFRASFTEAIDSNQRLFLVQDYVEGQTYRALLRQRLQKGDRFSESEIRQLLAQLLPVLAHIHSQSIIHRDLSLDNLILRTADQKPVLIDFGVVKTVVTQLQQSNVLPSGTVVGKFGYAPIEQLQSGRAYPSSDLYSLAVCCLVLLTGLEPAQLLDDTSAKWNWRSHTTVSDELAAILERMLAYKPSDRYPQAEAVLQALQNLPSATATPSPPSSPSSPSPPLPPPPSLSSPDHSQIRTIAVTPPPPNQEKRPQKPVIPPVQSAKPSPQEDSDSSSHSGWLILVSLATAAIVSAGLGWAAMQFLSIHPWSKKDAIVSPSPSPIASQPKPSPPSVRYSESLQLEPGQAATVQGSLQSGETQTYRFQASKGDELSAQLTGAGLTFSLLNSDLTPLSDTMQGTTDWQGTIPRNGTYYARVQNNSTGTAQGFQLTLALATPPPPEPSPSPSVTPSPSPSTVVPEPIVTETALNLQAGPPQQFNGQLAPAQVIRYIVPVAAGQALSAAVMDQNQVTLTIRDATGQPLSSAQNVLTWEALIPEAGNYQIDVVSIDGTRPTDFAIAIGVKQP